MNTWGDDEVVDDEGDDNLPLEDQVTAPLKPLDDDEDDDEDDGVDENDD